jgi:hypothetical protein
LDPGANGVRRLQCSDIMVDVIQIITSSGAKFSYGCNPSIIFRGIQRRFTVVYQCGRCAEEDL